MLAATGVAGAPDSFFQRGLDPVWVAEWRLPSPHGMSPRAYAEAYLRAAQVVGRGRSGMFGVRLMQPSLADLLALIAEAHPGPDSDAGRLRAAFGEVLFVHLARDDRVAQAVSLEKARQSGLWHIAPDGTEIERLSPPRVPVYDFARLRATVDDLSRQDTAWRDWFAAQGIAPYSIRYEALSADPQAVVRGLCAHLGLAVPDALAPPVGRLADATSCDWIRRYHEDTRAFQGQDQPGSAPSQSASP